MTATASAGGSTALYAVPIQEAITSGDIAKMNQIRDEAFAYLASASDIERLLPELEKAIQAKGGPIRVLYGVSIQDAIARGDQAEIARLKAEVAYYSRLL